MYTIYHIRVADVIKICQDAVSRRRGCDAPPALTDWKMTGLSLNKNITTGPLSANFSKKWGDINDTPWNEPQEMPTMSFIIVGQFLKCKTLSSSYHLHKNKSHFCPHWKLTWLSERTINWGCSPHCSGEGLIPLLHVTSSPKSWFLLTGSIMKSHFTGGDLNV